MAAGIVLTGTAGAQSATDKPAAAPAAAPQASAAQASDPKVDEVEKKLEEAYSKVKSYSGKLTSTTEMEYGEGMSMKAEMEGTIEAVRKDRTFLTRSDLKSKTNTKMQGTDMKMEQVILSIMDGEYTYSLVDNTDGPMKGQKQAMKFKITEPQDPAPIKDLKKDNNLKLLADEKVDGSDCYVVEATPKSAAGGPGQPTRMVSYLRKESGLLAKMVSYAKDKPMMTMTMTDVKMNPSIDAERFKFKAPEGVEVQEMPAMGGAGMGTP